MDSTGYLASGFNLNSLVGFGFGRKLLVCLGIEDVEEELGS